MDKILKTIFAIPTLLMCGIFTHADAQTVAFNEIDGKHVITVIPEKNTGLNAIYVAWETNGLTLEYAPSQSSVRPVLYRYSTLGGGYAEEFSGWEMSGGKVIIRNPIGDTGYIIEEGDKRYYFWLVDYSTHKPDIHSINIPDTSDCGYVTLNISASGNPIHYYTINGRRMTLNQEFYVQFNTLEWDEESTMYVPKNVSHPLESLSSVVTLTPPPYCATHFTLSGDRFLREWGEEVSCESGYYQSVSVEVHTTAEQIFSDNDHSNQIGSTDDTVLGGSAPAFIKFSAYTTDAVVHNEWQLSSDPEFENILYRFTEHDLEYEFRDEGNWYVRFIGSNSDGSCQSEGDVYTVAIGASELVCPNAFSPGASEGVNDEWRVSYKSLLDFKCWIFDRYGTQIYYFDSPDGGWDGKYRGKYVKPGVYYYVIEATGAEGKKYKKSGDINILRFSRNGENSQITE